MVHTTCIKQAYYSKRCYKCIGLCFLVWALHKMRENLLSTAATIASLGSPDTSFYAL